MHLSSTRTHAPHRTGQRAPRPPADRAHLYSQRPPLVRSSSSTPPHALASDSDRATRRSRVLLRDARRPGPGSLALLRPLRTQQPRSSSALRGLRLTKQSLSAGRTNGAARPQNLKPGTSASGPASSDVDELDQLRRGFPCRVRPRLRRHRAHPRPPGLPLRRRRPQARPRRPRQAALPKGAGRGVAAGARVPAQRAARRAGRQAREGGRGRRAVPAQGGPRGARRVRGAAPRAPRHVRLLPRSRRGREPRRRRHRRRVRAHLRGQGRRLDARRRRPLQDVCGLVQEDPPHEELRGRQPISKDIIPMMLVVALLGG